MPPNWFVASAVKTYRLLAGFGLRLYGDTSGFIGIRPSDSSDGTDYVLPASRPVASGILGSDSAGNLSWVSSFAWQPITSSRSVVAENGYITNNASLITLTLPASAAIGDSFRIAGMGAGGWRLSQLAGQTVHFGDKQTTIGTSGYVRSQQTFDCIEVICITVDTDWLIVSSHGNILVT